MKTPAKVIFTLIAIGLFCMPALAQTPIAVPNGDFESWTSGDADNWTEDSQGGITGTQETGTNVTPYEGSSCANLTWTTGTQSDCDYINDAVSVTEGETYNLSLYYYDNDIAGRITVYFDYDVGSSSYPNIYSSDAASWQEFSFSAVAPAGATTMQITIRGYDIEADWDGDATVYVDDVTLTEGTGAATEISIYDLNYPASGGTCYDGPHNGDTNILTYGIVTAISGSNFVIQETEHSTYSGIYGYAGGFDISGMSVEDSIAITGNITEYYGLTEITGLTDLVVVSSGHSITPTFVTAADISPACDEADEAYENVLVKVLDVTIDSTADHGSYWASDGVGTAFLVDDDLLYPLPVSIDQNFVSITGVSKYAYDANRLEPRGIGDFESAGNLPPVIGSVLRYPYPTVYPTDEATVSANITDDGTIASAYLYVQETALTFNPVSADSTVGDIYWFTIGTNPIGTLVEYYVEATDDEAATSYSDTSSYTVADPSLAPIPIYDVQYTLIDTPGCYPSPENGNTVTLTGVVSATLNNRTRFYFQDADSGWSGLYAYNASDSVSPGDSITAVGQISEYNGLTEFYYPTITIEGTGTIYDPIAVTSAEIGSQGCAIAGEPYEGMLVQLTNFTVTSGPTAFGEWWGNDGSGDSCMVEDYLYFDLDLTVGLTYEITGICHYSYDQFRVYPRNADDIVPAATSPVISNVQRDPSGIVQPSDVVTVTADITDDGTITNDSMYVRLDSGAWTAYYHDSVTPPTYTFTIGSNSAGTFVEYYIIAEDNDANRTETDIYSYTVQTIGECTADYTIYDIQSNYTFDDVVDSCFISTFIDSGVVSVCGVVTAVDNVGSGTGVFLQDPDGTTFSGVLLYDQQDAQGDSISFATTEIGDYFQIWAAVSEYVGITELDTLVDFTLLGTGMPLPETSLTDVNTLAQTLPGGCSFTGEGYEGVLSRINNLTVLNTPGYGKWWVTDASTTDSILLGPDLFNMTGATYPPSEGLLYESVVGIVTWDQYDDVLKIMPRMDSDLIATVIPPPTILATYPIDQSTLCVLFDKALDQGTAETPGNYTIQSGLAVTGASLDADLRRVFLDLSPDMGNGVEDSITVTAVQDTSGHAIVSESDNFWQGFTPISLFQTPGDPGSDVPPTYPTDMQFEVVTVKGVVVADTVAFQDSVPDYYAANNIYINDSSGPPSNGVLCLVYYNDWDPGMYVPVSGDEIVMSAEISDYYGATELTNIDDYKNVYLVNSGSGSLPEPEYKTYDASEFAYNVYDAAHESFEGVLVKLCDSLEVVYLDTDTDTTRVLLMSLTDNADTISFSYKYRNFPLPVVGERYDGVAGVIRWRWGYWRLQPRAVADLNTGFDCEPGGECLEFVPGDANMINGQWPPLVIGGDVTYLVGYFRGLNPPCLVGGFYSAGDANGDCLVIGSDVTRMVAYFRGLQSLSYCPDNVPCWPTPGDVGSTPEPDGWPNCETPATAGKALQPGQSK
jgi:predicted extracellular nuclease